MIRLIYLPLLSLWLLLPLSAAGQPSIHSDSVRLSGIESRLAVLVGRDSTFCREVDITSGRLLLSELLRNIARASGVNLSVRSVDNIPVSCNFRRARVDDLVMFLCREYRLDIAVAGNILSVFPAAATPSPSPDPDIVYQASEFGGEKEVVVTSNAAWTVSSSADWCTLSTESGHGGGYFTVSIAPNSTSAPRAGAAVITVKALNIERTLTITQSAPTQQELSVSDTNIESIETVSSRMVIVRSSNDWSATSADAWCVVEKIDAESLKVDIEDNTDDFKRTTVITVTSDNESKEIAVTQRGGKVYLSEMWASENLGEQPYGTLYHGLNDEIECPEGYVLPSRTDLNALNSYVKRFDDTVEDNPGNINGMWIGHSSEAVNAATADDPQKCIFLPASGYLTSGDRLQNRDQCGYYWSRNATTNSGYMFRIGFTYYYSGTTMVQEVPVMENIVNKRAARCIKEKYSLE